ncbi:putative LmbE-like protein [Beggiatoa alba B18LD]|uniref:Putative LmbE-like protein n=1 Tax=Beggiatoa alba B18LD TaxID=395493 RepID=I3CI78_9GAMM|nr:PIG-L family deacetylase [Beggiatoa alba]EIJ43321.1 putative LmbE-like protein [Beggiatoa alba B18LD]
MESFFIPYQATQTLPQGTILVLAPHPDDEVFGCGGAIMQHIAQGNTVRVIILTDGSAATTHADEDARRAYIQLRQAESRQAAKHLGYGEPLFWEIPDRHLQVDSQLIEKLRDFITTNQIQQIYAPSPAEIHPDHYACAQLALSLLAQLPITYIMYEIGMPLRPNQLLDITPYLDRKQQATNCFSSQLSIQDYGRHLYGLNVYRSYTLPVTVIAAEAYYVLTHANWRENPFREFGESRQTTIMSQMARQLTEQAQRLTEQTHTLERVYYSTSWRVTYPLRAFKQHWRLLKRLLHKLVA